MNWELKAVCAAFALAASTTVGSVKAEPWLGQKLPPPVNTPGTSVVDTGHADLPSVPATFGPGPKSAFLKGEVIKRDVRTIVGFSLESQAAGDYLWGRVSGTPSYYKTVNWAVEELKKAGLKDAHLEDFTASLTIPTAGEARLLSDPSLGEGSQDIVLQSAMVGGKGPVNGVVTAPLVYVGHATLADLGGRDVRGKIAVLHTSVNPGIYSADEIGRPAQLVRLGAVGVIEILDQVGNMQSYDADRHGCGTWFCFTVGGADGFFLENLLGKAVGAGKTINARLSSTAREQTGLRTANGVATLPGRTQRTIIINAHADAWFTGADDNASGLATTLALARWLAGQPRPEHTLVFVISAGHHTAGQGVPSFRLRHENDYVTNADLVLNIEHVAALGMVREAATVQDDNFGRPWVATSVEWPKSVAVSNRAPFLIDLWGKGVRCFGLSVQRVVDKLPPGELGGYLMIERMRTSGAAGAPSQGIASLKNITDIPLTQMISAGMLYHTTGESVDSVTNEGLERAARFHAFFVKAVDSAARSQLQGAAAKVSQSCPLTP